MEKQTANVGSDIGKVVYDDCAPIVKLRDQFWKSNKIELLKFAREHNCLLYDEHIAFPDDQSFVLFRIEFE